MRARTLLLFGSLALSPMLILLGAEPGSAGQSGISPAGIIATLNAERRANGIPAGISVKSAWSQNCDKHDHYMDANDTLTHFEEQGKPAYTTGGAWAGQNAVLSYGASWKDGDVFDQAPIHLAQLLQPKLDVSGAYEYQGQHALWGCVITLAGYNRPDPSTNRVYTYPGNGRTGVATHYFAQELPATPNQLVGAPAKCGQELFVFVSGPALTAGSQPNPYLFEVTSAKLRPKGGSAVAVKIADGLTKFPQSLGGGQLGYYLGPGAAIVIPVKPLKPSTTYLATVTMKGNGVTLAHHWSFTTAKS